MLQLLLMWSICGISTILLPKGDNNGNNKK